MTNIRAMAYAALIVAVIVAAVLLRAFILALTHKGDHAGRPEPARPLPPLPCAGLCGVHVGDPAANNRCAEPCDRIVPHALHLCAEHRIGPDGLPKPRNWPPPTVRTQDELGRSTMVLPRLGTPIRTLLPPRRNLEVVPDPEHHTLPVVPPREWRVGRAPSPFVINPPDVRTLAFRLMLPVIQPEPDEPDPVGIAERIREYYRDLDWPVSEYLFHHAWFDTEGLAA